MIRRLVVVVLGTALVAAGCGGGGEEVTDQAGADLTRGKELFVSNPDPTQPNCGQCHTLAAADTSTTVGPNLDDAFGYSREQGFDDSTFFDVTLAQIDLAAPPMPADIYEGQDAVDVAAYVAACAGLGPDDLSGACAAPTPGDGGAASGATEPAETGGSEAAPAETEGGASDDGKQVFAFAGCGSCHTLADAGSTGTIGQNLDESKPPRELVVERVTNGKGAMPSFEDGLSREQIEAVADYVSSVAGK